MQSVAPKTTAADITDAALRSFDLTASPRGKLLLQTAVKHLHAFAMGTDLTANELIKLADIFTTAEQISGAGRHEFLLMSDVMGLTMVVDYNTNKKPGVISKTAACLRPESHDYPQENLFPGIRESRFSRDV